MVKTKEDMTGWNMWEHGVPNSRLTVIEQSEDYIASNGCHFARWLCECNCEQHKKFIVSGYNIRSGRILSCGCYAAEHKKQKRKNNKFDLTGEYGIGWTSNTNEEFYFDLEDYDKIKDYTWRSVTCGTTKGIVAWDKDRKRGVRMHQLLGFNGYDHADRNELNNRKENLRFATSSQNNMNRTKSTRNTSGIVGVWFEEERKKWRATISIDKKEVLIGRFVNKEDAIIARLKAEKEYYGEFAPQRHLFEQYGI